MNYKKRIAFYLISILVISVGYSMLSDSTYVPGDRPEKESDVFELIMSSIEPKSKPRLRAKSAILVDLETGEVLAKKNENDIRPIASLTKLATAIVYLETNPDLLNVVTITRDDRRGSGRSRLYKGMKVTAYDLFHIMLISSDNVAAKALARSTGFTNEEFAEKMCQLAAMLNLEQTSFVEPSGLKSENVSTATEFAVMFKTALEYPMISEAIAMRNFTYKALNRERQYIAYNTNRLLYWRDDVFGGKTGYIKPSGYCLALGINSDGKRLVALVLGSSSNRNRYRDAVRLVASVDSPNM